MCWNSNLLDYFVFIIFIQNIFTGNLYAILVLIASLVYRMGSGFHQTKLRHKNFSSPSI